MSSETASLTGLVSSLRGVASGVGAMFELSLDGRVARLTLARAATRNALTTDDWRALPALVEQAMRLKARVILLSSRIDGAFCAGADLRELATLHEDPSARIPFRNVMRAALDSIRSSPIPVIALVDGDCFGAGVALAIACDMRIAGPAACFAVTPAKLGIGYPLEDIARLRALIGDGQAARMMLAADAVKADEAVRIGLAELAGGEADALRLAAAIAANAPSSVAMLKRGLSLASGGQASDEGHDRAFDSAFGGGDFAEGIAAFRARRTPDFEG
jgi:enoyl-CoA hydratase/carnithine racemase